MDKVTLKQTISSLVYCFDRQYESSLDIVAARVFEYSTKIKI